MPKNNPHVYRETKGGLVGGDVGGAGFHLEQPVLSCGPSIFNLSAHRCSFAFTTELFTTDLFKSISKPITIFDIASLPSISQRNAPAAPAPGEATTPPDVPVNPPATKVRQTRNAGGIS